MPPEKPTAEELNQRPRQITDVNRFLQKAGINETLRAGHGYFFFEPGNAFRWPSQGTYVCAVGELTMGQWLRRYEELASKAREGRDE